MEVSTTADGQVRRATVLTKNGLLRRPAVKLALLDLKTPGQSGTTRVGECCGTTGRETK